MVFRLLLLLNIRKSKTKFKVYFLFYTSHPLFFQKVIIFKKTVAHNPKKCHPILIINVVPNSVGLNQLYAVKRASEKADLRHETLERRTDMRPIPRETENGRRTRKST
jgi:hypothetical protein